MKPFPWKCGTCRERAVRPITLPSYPAEMEHDGRSYRVTLEDFSVLQCERCDAIMLDDAAHERLSNALRSEAGLLTPAEIRTGREALSLTQKAFAACLQIAESTLSRWETGAQIQQRCMDRFLRAVFGVQELRRFLGIPVSAGSWSVGQQIGIKTTSPLMSANPVQAVTSQPQKVFIVTPQKGRSSSPELEIAA